MESDFQCQAVLLFNLIKPIMITNKIHVKSNIEKLCFKLIE